MSVTSTGSVMSYLANTDLTACQCRLVSLKKGPNGKQGIELAQPTDTPLGVLLDKPAKGDPGAVQTHGRCAALLAPNKVAGSGVSLELAADGLLQPIALGEAVAKYMGTDISVAKPYSLVIDVLLWPVDAGV